MATHLLEMPPQRCPPCLEQRLFPSYADAGASSHLLLFNTPLSSMDWSTKNSNNCFQPQSLGLKHKSRGDRPIFKGYHKGRGIQEEHIQGSKEQLNAHWLSAERWTCLGKGCIHRNCTTGQQLSTWSLRNKVLLKITQHMDVPTCPVMAVKAFPSM